MAFNPLQYLKLGLVDFLYDLTEYDRKQLINWVREDKNRNEIINGFLSKLIDNQPLFCLEIIYDMDDYEKEAMYLMDEYPNYLSSCKYIKNILFNTKFGKKFVKERLNTIIKKDKENINVILEYTFTSFEDNKDLIEMLYLHPDLHIRYIFMKYVIENHKAKTNIIYDNIMKYLTSYTHKEYEQLTFLPELMSSEDISKLAVAVYESNDKELWYRMKEYILETYEYNDLAQLLIEKDINDEYERDADKLFITSRNYQYEIYRNHSKQVSEELLTNFQRYIQIFSNGKAYDGKLHNQFFYGLGHDLIRYVDKYLSLSKDKTYEYIKSGSCTSCFRVGDYAFKLSNTKWSYEDIICPNLYLILKNLEEHYIRDSKGVVLASLEIQPYLTKEAVDLPSSVFEEFENELNRLGYYTTDRLVGGMCGNNCMLLDSYKDADCYNPEILPDWFKKTPLVLIDRDRIYKLDNKWPKQLKERGWY